MSFFGVLLTRKWFYSVCFLRSFKEVFEVPSQKAFGALKGQKRIKQVFFEKCALLDFVWVLS